MEYYHVLLPVWLLNFEVKVGLKSKVLLAWFIEYILWTGVIHELGLSTLVVPSMLSVKVTVISTLLEESESTPMSKPF